MQVGLTGWADARHSKWLVQEWDNVHLQRLRFTSVPQFSLPGLKLKVGKNTAQKYIKKTRLRNMPRIVLLGGGKSSLGPWSWSYWWFQGKRWNKILHPSTCGRLKYNSYKANLGAIIDTPGMRDLENAERNSFSSLFYFWLAMASIQEFKRVLSALDLTQQSIEWISEINALCPEWKDIPITSAHSLSVSWLGLSLVLSTHNLWGTSATARRINHGSPTIWTMTLSNWKGYSHTV